ncbi:TerC family protein [Roseiterribacter gracilis]|uniref:Membrane protein n=1 Tax=Roseiterribacter gracilis TaxID=2812848 RepID=A0A8S8X960_9PROT|nr:membrane protein [Rhodospirillales bacterium TMPK1]
MEFWTQFLIALGQVIMIDLVLAGDNAIIVGLAAASVAADQRKKVIFWGIAAAVILRVLFALVTVQLLAIIGLTLAGGILLLWVCWKFWRELRHQAAQKSAAALDPHNAPPPEKPKSVRSAIVAIAAADVSMSLDNVLAVAGAARDNQVVLITGLLLSVVLMGFAANAISRLLQKYHWLAYVGLVIILYVACDMVWRGWSEVAPHLGVG